LFDDPKAREVAKATLEVIRREFERLPRSADLAKPEIQKQIVEKVKEIITPAQQELEGIAEPVNVAEVVAKATTHEKQHGGKPWTYLLIPHDVITDNKTLQGLAATYTYGGAPGGKR